MAIFKNIVQDDSGAAPMGVANIGFVGHTGYAGFSHKDRATTANYALLQASTGETYLNGGNNSAINFRISNNNKMRLTSNGNFGIGTTSPAYKLDVNGSIGVADYIYHGGDNDTHILFGVDLMLLKAGNIELIRAYEDAGRGYVTINEGSAAVDFRIESDFSTHAFFLNSDGRIGIGVSNPTEAIDMLGSIKTNQYFKASVNGGGLQNTWWNTWLFSTSNTGWISRSGGTESIIELQDSTGGTRGSFYGLGDITAIRDRQNRWAMLHVNGQYTRFYDNNELVFHIGQGFTPGEFGSVSTYGNGEGGWEGYNINGWFAFIAPDQSQFGIYNDANNEWMIRGVANNAIELFYDGQPRMVTTTDGIKVQSNTPRLYLTDLNSNPDWSLINANGLFRIWNDTSNAVGLQVDTNNNTVFGSTSNGTSKVDITGTAMRQLRLRTQGGPTSAADTNGDIGDIAYDADHLYIKTSNGWGRVALDFAF